MTAAWAVRGGAVAAVWGLGVAALVPRLGGVAAEAALDFQALGWLGAAVAYIASCRAAPCPRRQGALVLFALLALLPWAAAALTSGPVDGAPRQSGLFAGVMTLVAWLGAPWAAAKFRR